MRSENKTTNQYQIGSDEYADYFKMEISWNFSNFEKDFIWEMHSSVENVCRVVNNAVPFIISVQFSTQITTLKRKTIYEIHVEKGLKPSKFACNAKSQSVVTVKWLINCSMLLCKLSSTCTTHSGWHWFLNMNSTMSGML